jgi:TolB-like protein/class 3 adenylate cyclase/tetratricopeptide (TPR) repeat protein
MTAKRRSQMPSMPVGTVTFLFTDIEGSTKLWETQHDAMQTSLARHDALLRQTIAAHGGLVFKTGGDAFCAAFATAASAVEAAFAAQRVLCAERWPEQAAIHARMALHTGAAEIRDGDYFGPPLNHVARLLAAGHGGQTLVSEITHDLCRDRLPAGTTLKSLGEHSLKDLARRETVFQLCHPDLPQAFPPLKTLLTPIDENVPSIAVLPFTDLSPEKDQEYFTDGLAEELLNVLSKIRGLRVVSRTSAFSFKGTKVDIPTVAQKLNVATILEGSVRKAGKRVRITAQLIQVATDSHLWSETYDRELEDIFAVQDDIAQSVVKELRSALFREKPDALASAAAKTEVQAATKGRGENIEAHRLYLQGRFFEDRLTREDTAKAIAYYQQALALDPEYVLAWTGLARTYADQAGFSWEAVAEGSRKARDAAERALELEPDLAEAHRAMGWIRMYHDWNWKGADASFRRALELAPGDAQVLRGAAALAGNLGRQEEAIGLLRRAVALDPLNVSVHRNLAYQCLSTGLLEEAEATANKALELNPQGGFPHYILGLVELAQGRSEEALATFGREVHEGFRLHGLSLAQHALGRPKKSDAGLRAFIEKYAREGAVQIAETYAYRGEANLAFEWLERAYAQRDPGLSELRIDFLLRGLHADPRWQSFLEKMRFVG